MIDQAPTLTLDNIDELLSVLSDKDRRMVIMAGIGALDKKKLELQLSKWQQRIRLKLTTIQSACRKLGIPIKDLLNIPLEAPLDVLDISQEIRSLLKNKSPAERVRDIYRARLTTTVCMKAGISEHDVSALDSSLVHLGLPRLHVSEANSAIYRFCNQEYADNLSGDDRKLLSFVDWNNLDKIDSEAFSLKNIFRRNVDPGGVADVIGMHGVRFLPRKVALAKKRLMTD
jgi:hypothetical protein